MLKVGDYNIEKGKKGEIYVKTNITEEDIYEELKKGASYENMESTKYNKWDKYDTDDDRVNTHWAVCTVLNDIYERKNNDYGNSFDKLMNRRGLASGLDRMIDKTNRLEQLIDGDYTPKVDESIEDSLMDLANYAIMTVMWLRYQDKNKKR